VQPDGKGVGVAAVSAMTKGTGFCNDLSVADTKFIQMFFCLLNDSTGELFHTGTSIRFFICAGFIKTLVFRKPLSGCLLGSQKDINSIYWAI